MGSSDLSPPWSEDGSRKNALRITLVTRRNPRRRRRWLLRRQSLGRRGIKKNKNGLYIESGSSSFAEESEEELLGFFFTTLCIYINTRYLHLFVQGRALSREIIELVSARVSFVGRVWSSRATAEAAALRNFEPKIDIKQTNKSYICI